MLASDCDHRTGMHVFEDLFVDVEVVDDDCGRAVADGSSGSRILVTTLTGTLPLIRFELTPTS